MINITREIVNQDELNAFFVEVEVPGFCNKIEIHKGRVAKYFVEYKGNIGNKILFHKTVEHYAEKLDDIGNEKVFSQGIYFLIDGQSYYFRFPKKYIFELLFYNNLINDDAQIQAIMTATVETTYLTQNETGKSPQKKIIEEIVKYEVYKGDDETLQLVENAKKCK